jgi:hypothetical protein
MFTYNPAAYNSPWHIYVASICSPLILLVGLWLWCSERSFIHSCSTATGTVSTDAHSSQSAYGGKYAHGDTYDLDYTFSASGRDYSGHGSLDYDPGKIVAVYFNRYNPAENRLEMPNTSIARGMTIAGILFTFGTFPWRWLRAKLSSRRG